MVTISEIAKLANVSRGTVDRVLHNRGNVSRELEQRVRDVLSTIPYRPNLFGQGLARTKPYTFGILVPDTSNDVRFWELPLRGISRAQSELHGYRVSLQYFHYNNSSEISFRQAADEVLRKSAELDGLLIAPVMSAYAEEFIQKLPEKLPIILFDVFIPSDRILAYVGADSFQSGVLSAKLMNRLTGSDGNIAIICEQPENYHINERIRGFKSFYHRADQLNYTELKCEGVCGAGKIADLTGRAISEIRNLKGVYIASSRTHEVAEYLNSISTESRIHLIGHDLTEENKAHVRQGTIDYLISQRPEQQGYDGIYALYRHVVLNEQITRKNILHPEIFIQENIDYC